MKITRIFACMAVLLALSCGMVALALASQAVQPALTSAAQGTAITCKAAGTATTQSILLTAVLRQKTPDGDIEIAQWTRKTNAKALDFYGECPQGEADSYTLECSAVFAMQDGTTRTLRSTVAW